MKKFILLFVVSNFILCISVFSQVPTNGLVAYYPFSGNANDESGNGHDGSNHSATITTDRFGKSDSAYNFTYGSWMDFGDILNDVFSSNIFSYSIWYKSDSSQKGGLIYKWYNGFWYTPESFSSSTKITSFPKMEVGVWTNDVVIINKGELSLFRNGNLIVKDNGHLIGNTVGYTLQVGGDLRGEQPWYQFFGSIDDIRIYDRILTESEISELFNENGFNKVQITSPTGGETFNAGTNINISWSQSGYISSIDLQYTTDNGNNWIYIDSPSPTSCAYSWAVPSNLNATQCRIKILGYYGGKIFSDSSHNLFSIKPPPINGDFFDDFKYSDKIKLINNGWNIRTNSGHPGFYKGQWSANNVNFINDDSDPGDTLLQLFAETSGTDLTTIQAEISTPLIYREGTYGARIHFQGIPVQGNDGHGDGVVQAFFTMSEYSLIPFAEVDFEYLPNSWKGNSTPQMDFNTWNSTTTRAHDEDHNPYDGWDTLMVTIANGNVTFFINGFEKFLPHSLPYYPFTDMGIFLQSWFDSTGLVNGSAYRKYEMDVDWVYHKKDVSLSYHEMLDAINSFRANNRYFYKSNTVTTSVTTSIAHTSASVLGNVTQDGCASIKARGVCWSTNGNPTILDSHTDEGPSTGPFTSNLTGLSAGTLYHYRAYVSDSIGTNYGHDSTFITSAALQKNIKVLLEGSYNGTTLIPDTITVELRGASSPYGIVSSSKGILDENGQHNFSFSAGIAGIAYYIVVKHRNAIETWSTIPIIDSSYDFTTEVGQAYGSNQIIKGSKWCLYSGDVNQDGLIDSGDLGIVDNDNAAYVSGYVSTDINGDGIVDSSDLGLVDNNNAIYVGKIVPTGAPKAIRVIKPVKTNKQE